MATERLEIARSLPDEAATASRTSWLVGFDRARSRPRRLAARLSLPQEAVDIALAKLESEGLILRGRFASEEDEFCHRRVLARIHRMTLGRLRREIEPVTAADFMRFLGRWQHLAPGTQLHGADGLFQVLRQLQGYEISAAAWESSVLPRRVANYDPELLDRLCLSGEIMWGRLSPHPALETEGGRRVRPTRVAPLALFLREDAKRLLSPASNQVPLLSHRRARRVRGARIARSLLLQRAGARHRTSGQRSRGRFVGTGRGGARHRRRL